jgi:hypothetical protein
MPDVLTAMLELHTGVEADEAPTRIRDVITELCVSPVVIAPAPVLATPLPAAVIVTPAPSSADWVTPAPVVVALTTPTPVVVTSAPLGVAVPVLTPAPEVVEDAWLTHSSLAGVESAPRIFESERVDPALHEALTWNPGPVVPAANAGPPPPALTIAEPLPEPSPYAPAVLPSRTSDVSELLDSFYVSDAAEERDLRSALKGMAGLELTPMPHPYVEEG